MKRNIVNKAEILQCKLCNSMISSAGLPSHIKHSHKITVDYYVSQFGEFRKNRLNVKKGTRNIPKITCEICNNKYSSIGMATHLRDTHDLTIDEYVKIYTEFRPKYIQIAKSLEAERFECEECGHNDFVSHQHLAHHVRIEHNITMKQYVLKHVYNNIHPYCKCNCGGKITIIGRPPYREYISGHNTNGMTGKQHSEFTKKKMSLKAKNRLEKNIRNDTSIEIKFEKILNLLNIEYEKQIQHNYGIADFFIPEYDLYIEVDGRYFHPVEIVNTSPFLFDNIISTYRKNKMTNCIHIRDIDIDNIKSIDDLHKFHFKYEYKLKDTDLILNEKYTSEDFLKNKKRIVRQVCKLLINIEIYPENMNKKLYEIVYNLYELKIPVTLSNINTQLNLT